MAKRPKVSNQLPALPGGVLSRLSTGAKRATDVIKIALGQTGIQMVNGFGSMEGLLRVLQNANGVPVLNYFDELELMFKKALVPGSAGTTPLHVLYEETSYSHTLRQRGTINLVNAHLALLGNSTTERFTDIWQGEHLDSGFFSRWMLVTAGLARRIPDPKPPDQSRLDSLCTNIKQVVDSVRIIAIAQGSPVLIGFADEAAAMTWHNFYMNEIDPEDVVYNRIDTIGDRLMMILAVAQGHTVIDYDTVRAVIDFLRYQVAVRRLLSPQLADNQLARVQQKILARLAKGDRLTRRDLYRSVHADRYGTQIFEMAIEGLCRERLVQFDGEFYALPTEDPMRVG
jgi:hypothetical protein